jgi:opacity protein-like surface antigen
MKKLFLLVAVCCVFVAANAFAASPIRTVGFDAGYVSPDVEGMDGTWTAGVFMDFGLPMQNLQINPFINYWNWSEDVTGYDTSFRDFQIGANLKYAFPTSSVKFQPFLAAGVGVHMLNASVEGAGVSVDEGDTKFGFQGGAGVKVGVSERASLVGSGWYNIVEDVNHWSARAGLAFNL